MKRLVLIFFTICFLFTLALNANAITYNFDHSNAFGAWTGSTPTGYGSVDITKGLNDWVYFEITANDSFFTADPAEPGLTWDMFYFNYAGTPALDTAKIIVDSVGDWSTTEDTNASMFGIFDYDEHGTKIKNNSLNPLNFHIEIAGLNLDDFYLQNDKGWYFAGHLRRFEAMTDLAGRSQTSTYLGVGGNPAPVPEPGTLLLLGSGVIGLALWKRRKNR